MTTRVPLFYLTVFQLLTVFIVYPRCE